MLCRTSLLTLSVCLSLYLSLSSSFFFLPLSISLTPPPPASLSLLSLYLSVYIYIYPSLSTPFSLPLSLSHSLSLSLFLPLVISSFFNFKTKGHKLMIEFQLCPLDKTIKAYTLRKIVFILFRSAPSPKSSLPKKIVVAHSRKSLFFFPSVLSLYNFQLHESMMPRQNEKSLTLKHSSQRLASLTDSLCAFGVSDSKSNYGSALAQRAHVQCIHNHRWCL